VPVYPYTGDTPLTYTQYLAWDGENLATLFAEPGGSYDVRVAPGWDLPVPPADGRWGEPEDSDDGGSSPADKAPAAKATAKRKGA
jgi:hypothetical protein